MRRLLTLLAIAGGAFLLTGVTAVLAFQWYIKQPAFIEEIRRALSESVGAQVDFQEMHVRGLNTIELSKVSVQFSNANAQPDPRSLLRVDLLQAKFSLSRLLQQTVELNQVTMVRPEWVLVQSPDRQWSLPFRFAPPKIVMMGRPLAFEFLLTRIELQKARFQAIQTSGEVTAAIEDFDLNAGLTLLPGLTDAKGSLSLESLRFGTGLVFTKIKAPIVLANRTVTIGPSQAFTHGGTATATFAANLTGTSPAFSATLGVKDVDLATLLESFGARTQWATGTLQLDAKVEGPLHQPGLAQGVGRLNLAQAEVATLNVLGTLGQTLGLPELRAPRFDEIKGEFKIADERLTFYNLEGASPLIEISGAGDVTFGGRLDLDMLLGLHPDLGDQIPSALRGSFNERDDKFRLITFKLSGPITNPSSNLQRKLLASARPSDPVGVPSLLLR